MTACAGGNDDTIAAQATAPITQGGADRLPDGSAPWVAAPVPASELAGAASPADIETTEACDANQLDAEPLEWFRQSAGGGVYGWISITTTSQEPCFVDGAPHVAVLSNDEVVIESDEYRGDPGERVGIVHGKPGAKVRIDWTPPGCTASTSGQRIRVIFEGSGGPVDVAAETPARPDCSEDPPEHDEGLRSHLLTSPPVRTTAQTPPAPSPLLSLQIQLDLPDAARLGETLEFVAILHNPTAAAVQLDPCPAFKLAAAPAVETQAHRLNCLAIGEVPAGHSERFQMRLPIGDDALAGVPEKTLNVSWQLAGPGITFSSDPHAAPPPFASGLIPLVGP